MGWSLLVTSTWFIVTVLHGSVNMWGIFTVWRYLGRPVENCPLKTHNTINVGDCLHIYAGSNIINDRKQFKLDNHECIILSSFFYSSVLPVSIYTCWENSKTYSSLPYALIILFSKNLLVYYYKCCNLIGYANRYLFVNRYRVARQATFFVKKQCLFLDFRNHFKERTNTSLFLLKQLDYSLEISMKRYS